MSKRIGREAIELIKQHYSDGEGRFETGYDVMHWLKAEHRIKCGYHQASAWDRQARLERADERQSTTFPSRRNGYVRQAAPAHGERVISRGIRHKDTRTRLVNDLREARADAAQPDASPLEKAKVALYEAANDLVDSIDGLTS